MNAHPASVHASGQTSRTRPFAKKSFPPLVAVAHADTPAVGAVGAILAATLTATGAILAAGILATGAIGAAIINNRDDDEPDEPIIAPGTPPSQRRVGQQDLPPLLRGFIDRDILLSAASSGFPDGTTGSPGSVKADYAFDGDVRMGPPRVERFTFRDRIVFRLEISDISDANGLPPVTFSVDSLTLSTIDVDGTDGHAEISFTAVQDDQVLWRWSAHVAQGQEPQMKVPEITTQRVVRNQNDLLIVRKLLIPIKYAAPKPGGSTTIEVQMASEGAGARV